MMLELRRYQERSLDTLANYLKRSVETDVNKAFYEATGRNHIFPPGLENRPYVCLRIPTGGGKTLMASHSIGIATREFLQVEHSVCLWLVPSNIIREQTLAALKDREHPYRQVLDARFDGNVKVLNLDEALSLKPAALTGGTVVIVSTLAAPRIGDVETRKIYENSGELMDHFSGLGPALRDKLEKDGDGQVSRCLANVLRLHCPIVIMDEAHNARTKLSFQTLTRFNPSCIMEFTATPVTEHHPNTGIFASNVLSHVSAWELKAEEMIKLPIELRTRANWKEVVGDAVNQQRLLEKLALDEERETGEYLRPIVLLQAESKDQDITVEVLKQCLLDDFRIPEEEIAVATGTTREIDGIDLFSRSCNLRFIITVQALREGWDCSFAYALCSVSNQQSETSVEQLLGRVLRMPRARRKSRKELNRAYAYVSSSDFYATAKSMAGVLEKNGFERMEAESLIHASVEQQLFDSADRNLFSPVSETVTQPPDLSNLPETIRDKVDFDMDKGTLSVQGPISKAEASALRDCSVKEGDRATVERIYQRSQGRTLAAVTSSRDPFVVPLLSIWRDGELDLFDDSCFLDSIWNLSDCDPQLTESDFMSREQEGKSGEIDVSEKGKIESRYIDELHEQLSMISLEPGWTIPALVNWLDRQIPHPDVTQTQSSLFIHKAVTHLIEARGLSLGELARRKFTLRDAVEKKIAVHRAAYRKAAYVTVLFSTDAADLRTSPDCSVAFDEDRYAPHTYYSGGWKFNKHYMSVVGELKSDGEEYECAKLIDGMAQVKHWVRNLDHGPESCFWLQTSTDRFYPDFVAELVDGRILVIEYKGEDRWSNDDSKEKRAVGELWAERSVGKCIFVMPKGKDFSAIRQVL